MPWLVADLAFHRGVPTYYFAKFSHKLYENEENFTGGTCPNFYYTRLYLASRRPWWLLRNIYIKLQSIPDPGECLLHNDHCGLRTNKYDPRSATVDDGYI